LRFPIDEIDEIADGFQGRFGFYLEDLASGATHARKEEERFPTASMCKIPLMVELFRQVEAGELSLGDRRRLVGEISRHGSGTLSLMRDQPELTLADYCRMMMAVSDNMATDFLMSVVGIEKIDQTMDEMGFPNVRTPVSIGRFHYAMARMENFPCNPENDAALLTKLKGGARDFDSVSYSDSPPNNVTSPREMALLVKRIHLGEIVSREASGAMIEMMKGCQDRRMMARHINPEIDVAQKTGSSGRIKGNTGIAYLASGPLLISAYGLASADDVDGGETIARISRLAVRAASPESDPGVVNGEASPRRPGRSR
jgi:beta-lactamase class A